MNVDHVSDDVIPIPTREFDRLELIFARQRHLLEKYHPIEKRSGLMLTELVPVNINSPQGQARLKDFAWRVTEELTEATSALDEVSEKAWTHYIEELSDAFHFLVELMILSNITPEDLDKYADILYSKANSVLAPFEDRLEHHMLASGMLRTNTLFQGYRNYAYNCIEDLGCAMNCLKQKAWKQTHMLTDEQAYRTHIFNAYLAFLELAKIGASLNHDQLFRIYWKKSEVNAFRQRSNY